MIRPPPAPPEAAAPALDIHRGDLAEPEIRALLLEHLAEMALHSPPESIHALDLDGLRQPDVSFWCAWRGDALAGCCALKALDARHGEIKSMRTARPHLRSGVAAWRRRCCGSCWTRPCVAATRG